MERPIIEKGRNVSLGIILNSDVDTVFLAINDPEVNRYLRFPGRVIHYNEEAQWVNDLGKKTETDRVFAIISNSGKDFMGTVGIHQIDWQSKTAYVGYLSLKKYWGKGFMTEAVGLMVHYAFSTLNMRKLHSSVFEPNIGSVRVLEKNGFRLLGRYSKHRFVPGHGYVDELLFEKFNEDHV